MTDSIRDLVNTAEYREALKSRLLAGTAKSTEIALARELGLITKDESTELSAKAYLSRIDPALLAVMNDITVTSMSSASQTLRMVRTATHIGVVMPRSVDANALRADPHAFQDPDAPQIEPEPSAPASEDEPDLMPAKRSASS